MPKIHRKHNFALYSTQRYHIYLASHEKHLRYLNICTLASKLKERFVNQIQEY